MLAPPGIIKGGFLLPEWQVYHQMLHQIVIEWVAQFLIAKKGRDFSKIGEAFIIVIDLL